MLPYILSRRSPDVTRIYGNTGTLRTGGTSSSESGNEGNTDCPVARRSLFFSPLARRISPSTRAIILSRSFGSGGAPLFSSVWLCGSM